MLMPEAAVDENYLFTLSKNEVRFARQLVAMQAISVSEVINNPTNSQFGLRIFVPNE